MMAVARAIEQIPGAILLAFLVGILVGDAAARWARS